ncbi:MAG: hypothetical protein QOF25_5600 [Mycobacterium sp.]|jgi:hypothetical protein|nr:hypothetical protein [Mycobacterium sp.]
MLHHGYLPFWRRHPAFVGAAAVLACWFMANGWYWAVAISATAATLVAIRRVRRSRAHRHAGLRARADYENRLNRYGDPRGVFGRYPPVQPGWFPDPQNRWQWRYFDGTTWTGQAIRR